MSKVQGISFLQQLFIKLYARVMKPTEKRHLMIVPPSEAHSVYLGDMNIFPSFQVMTLYPTVILKHVILNTTP